MGRSVILMLLAAVVIVVAASAGGWMALNSGGSPEAVDAGSQSAIGPGDSETPEARVLGVSVTPGRLSDERSSPATIGIDSSGGGSADWGWAISLAIAVSLAAFPIVGVYELRGLRLRGEVNRRRYRHL